MTPDADAAELIVVDASIVVAIVAASSVVTTGLAARVGDASLHAPMILPAEVDSALRGLERAGRLNGAQAAAARVQAHALPIELWPWELIAERAWQLRANLTSYDAGYVALAERLGATLLTGDARLASAPGMRCRVETATLG